MEFPKAQPRSSNVFSMYQRLTSYNFEVKLYADDTCLVLHSRPQLTNSLLIQINLQF